MNYHEVKIKKENYENVKAGTKTFKILENDRAYQKGDRIKMYAVDNTGQYILGEPSLSFKIGDVYPIENNKVVFSLLKIEREKEYAAQ